MMIYKLKKKDVGIISDLHLGIEYDIKELGILLPFKLEKYLLLFDEIDCEKLIILGDVKHQIFRNFSKLTDFFNIISKKYNNIIITKGNHDGRLEQVVKKYQNIKICKFYIQNESLFFHGHIKLPEELLNLIGDNKIKNIFIGHLHPCVELRFKDEIYSSELIKCILKYETNNFKIIILPTISPFLKGTNILQEFPELKIFTQLKINKENFSIIVNNINIGKIKELKRFYLESFE